MVESAEPITIRTHLAKNVVMTARMNCPPQVDHSRVFELARLHLRAFYYRITFDRTTRTGRGWPGLFVPVMLAPKSNWGDRFLLEFSNATRGWPHRLLGVTANGFFKVSIRRHAEEHAACWAWALEWNAVFRIVGFFGLLEPAMAAAWSFDARLSRLVAQYPDGFLALGHEQRLPPSEDTLFMVPEAPPNA
ncbi:MAG: hypothetical protein EDX89_22665 [Acidobacteria bacterium]|nr:MAG: hypothetical protein EDX89_22665 [Acidobacteriota bacterium]